MLPVIDFIHTNRDRYVSELKDYLAIPSVSALPEHAADVRRCAEWTAEEMRRTFNMGLGFLVVVPAEQAGPALRAVANEQAVVVGEIVSRTGEGVEWA